MYFLNDIYTNGYYYNLLNIISILSVSCGIAVIVAKNPIVSVLFLIGLFFSIASYLMMLGLNFIGLSYLLVYVGAVSILFLFILMLINVRISELVTDNNNSFILSLIIGLLILVSLHRIKDNMVGQYFTYRLSSNSTGTGISFEHKDLYNQTGLSEEIINTVKNYFFTFVNDKENVYFVTSKIWDGALAETSHITTIGNILYTSYPLWLILTSIILLLAMVGAIIITIKQE